MVIHWHNDFTLGFFIVSVMSEQSPLPRAIWNTVDNTTLRAITRRQLVKTQQTEKTVRAAVNFKVCESVIALSLIVVTSFKTPINPITNPDPSIVTLLRDSMIMQDVICAMNMLKASDRLKTFYMVCARVFTHIYIYTRIYLVLEQLF
jgi:hypothetical protein